MSQENGGSRRRRLSGILSGRDLQDALRIFDCFDSDDPGEDQLRDALHLMGSPEVLDAVAIEMLPDHDPVRLQAAASFSERALGAARSPTDRAIARWLAAVVAERFGDVLGARARLELAHEADPRFGPAADRLAWYLSDTGDAAGAATLWRRLGLHPDEDPDLTEVEPFAVVQPVRLGRNEACWCGSGRKFKACHLGVAPVAPLPDRIGWLCRKASAFLERRGGGASAAVFEVAAARAGGEDDREALSRAFDDPFVIDITLTEQGWFERFVAERGALLPDDEALLASSWVLVTRSVFEITETTPGISMKVRDLRTGEIVQCRERTFSRTAHLGALVCARPVPDGETHQFVGRLFLVAPGTEAQVLDLIERGDGLELASYIGALERPPTLLTRENEPILVCTALFEVADADEARRALDVAYEREDRDRWVELFELHPEERILRASLTLARNTLKVETMSEPRMDRVIGVLSEIEGVSLASQERRPFDPSDAIEAPTPMSLDDLDPAMLEVLHRQRDAHELRWIGESIPALSGLTPREAAADPTRRESLERLIASFDELSERHPDALGMRADRLRELLGL